MGACTARDNDDDRRGELPNPVQWGELAPMTRSLQFVLVPDAGAARRVRRRLAERGARSGTVVGTWPELLDWARRAYLVSAPGDVWGEALRRALGAVSGAFWCESFAVAPEETAETVGSALHRVLSASDPHAGSVARGLEVLPARARRHLADLLRLAEALAGRLPDDLFVIRALLAAEAREALRTIAVHRLEGVPPLSRWQAALVDKLNRDAGERTSDGDLVHILGASFAAAPGGRGALGVLQSGLFAEAAGKADLDHSVQWIGVRDFLQEAEVAAGMVQRLLAEDRALAPADIALLIPESFEYALALEDAFGLGGLALSGLSAERWRRDVGREALFHFLFCRQKPAPAMALAVCLSSPLMPWSREEGAALAQRVMDGDYRLRAPPRASADARAMLALLREGDSEPPTLVRALREFSTRLGGGESFAEHVQQARAAAAELCAGLERASGIDWPRLRRAVIPKFVTAGETADFNLEGVTVWRESQEPWRSVRHLLVLGFAHGHYPIAAGASPVFSAAESSALHERLGLAVSTPAEELARRRARLRRQLGAVSDTVTFLVPRRDRAGVAQAPSETLVFVQRLFAGAEGADDLVVELDAAADRSRVRHLALAAAEPPHPPRSLSAADLRFGHDLLALRVATSRGPKRESPSSLETLMVSPLAWLLRRLAAEPLGWAPEAAAASVLGILAHEVFEGLFRPGAALPSREAIPRQVEALLEGAMRRAAPFLRASQWQVERRHLAAGIVRAAAVWCDMLAGLGAEVLASEVWLQGFWSDIPVHGQADLILGLPGRRLLVVDYKRSKSQSRRPRMERGYDSQAHLYRAMLERGGPASDDQALRTRLRGAERIGIVYYMLNDQIALSDYRLPQADTVPGWQAVENDVAARAMALIGRRLVQVREGLVCLNREGDAEFFEKQAGFKPYALAVSPLIGLFALPGSSVEGP